MINKKKIPVALFNDTNLFPHIGCKAVSDANNSLLHRLGAFVLFRHYLGEYEYLANSNMYESVKNTLLNLPLVHEISSVEAILINGEGTIHHGYGLHLLAILAAAQELGKPTYLFNAVMQEIPESFFSVLRKLNDLTVRDLFSFEYLQSNNIKARLIPDSILMANFYKEQDTIWKGKIVVTDCVANRKDIEEELRAVLDYYKNDAVYFPLEGDNASNWRDSLKKLSCAKLVVTGRHHGLYLALMAKRPFIALPSNTWKIEGTLAILNGENFLWKTGDNLLSMIKKACQSEKKYLPIFEHDFLTNPERMLEIFAHDFSLEIEPIEYILENNIPSDIYINQYKWACQYIKPGDRILNLDTDLGKSIILSESDAESIHNLSANKLNELSHFSDETFDIIVAFETFKHVKEISSLFQNFYRLLTPGGRIVLCIPNYHKNIANTNFLYDPTYDWNVLKANLSVDFIPESAYIQLIMEKTGVISPVKQVSFSEQLSEEYDFLLITAMKSPLKKQLPYQERVFPNLLIKNHPSVRYVDFYINPWLIHSMVNISYRLKNPVMLENLADQVLHSAPLESNDYGAALCVKAYKIFERFSKFNSEVENIIVKINQFINTLFENEMKLRWTISLLFIKGKLLQHLDDLENAKQAFIECSKFEARKFGVHLLNKSTEAIYLAGRISYIQGNPKEAHMYWCHGIEYAKKLLDISVNDITINSEYPNCFNVGDGIHKYMLAWDNVARCANGIYLLNKKEKVDFSILDASYAINNNLIQTKEVLLEHSEKIIYQQQQEIKILTDDLINVRKILVDRTKRLEEALKNS